MKPLTTGQVRQFGEVSYTTVQQWCDYGLLKGYKLPSGYRRFEVLDVVEFFQANGMPVSEELLAMSQEEK
ncbi:MAG: hypothetical protein IAF94_26280 [Pirellulaceae bacterium]|nr:hypothetical protein [Pirellulaceae bacterium]